MGQPITISRRTVADDVAAFDTDRSITGQDGVGFAPAEEPSDSLPGGLAAALFEADPAIEHVFVASNQVVATRQNGWTDAALDAAAAVVTDFFVFYR